LDCRKRGEHRGVAETTTIQKGMIDEGGDGREDQVWSLGPDLWGRCRNDYRLFVGWLVNFRRDPKDNREGGLGESGGDLRRPIREGTEQQRETERI